MVTVIMGLKGSGKTKQMIDMINRASQTEHGDIIAIERGQKLDTEVHARTARLIEMKAYDVRSYQVLRGFITGLYAGNYDITHIFIDSLLKIAHCDEMGELERFLDWMDRFGEANNITFTVSVSADVSAATDKIKSYFL